MVVALLLYSLLTLAAAGPPSAATTAVRAVGVAPLGHVAFEFIGKDEQPDLNHATFYGYVTHLRGVPDRALFAGATQDDTTARITFTAPLVLTQHLAQQPLFVTSGTGTLVFYVHPNGGASLAMPSSFARGRAIASASARFHDIINAQSSSAGIETSYGEISQRTAQVFTLGGKRYRFGRRGLQERFTTAGEGMRTGTPPNVQRTIIAAGDAVVTR
jgi:hypothetical protein